MNKTLLFRWLLTFLSQLGRYVTSPLQSWCYMREHDRDPCGFRVNESLAASKTSSVLDNCSPFVPV